MRRREVIAGIGDARPHGRCARARSRRASCAGSAFS